MNVPNLKERLRHIQGCINSIMGDLEPLEMLESGMTMCPECGTDEPENGKEVAREKLEEDGNAAANY